MSVSQIIKELEKLSDAERRKVIRVASALNKPSKVSSPKRGVRAASSRSEKKSIEDDPLWKVIGIAEAGSMTNEEIDRELYG